MKVHKPTDEEMNAFARRVIAGLPDSIAAQVADLLVLMHFLPTTCEARGVVREMLHALLVRERAQKEFCFPTATPLIAEAAGLSTPARIKQAVRAFVLSEGITGRESRAQLCEFARRLKQQGIYAAATGDGDIARRIEDIAKESQGNGGAR